MMLWYQKLIANTNSQTPTFGIMCFQNNSVYCVALLQEQFKIPVAVVEELKPLTSLIWAMTGKYGCVVLAL